MTRRPDALCSPPTIRRQCKGERHEPARQACPHHWRFERHRFRHRPYSGAKGAKVVISGRRSDVLVAASADLKGAGDHVSTIAADVGTAKGRATTLRTALEALGGLDVLINNAGGVRAGRLEATSEAEIEAMVTVDLLAPILLTRAALPALRASGDAVVVSARMTSGSTGPYTRWHSTEMTRRSLMGVPIRVQAPEPRPNVTLRLRGGGKWLHLQRTMVFRGRKSRSNEMSKLVSAVSAFEASAKGAERGEGMGWRSLRMRWTMT